MARRQSEMSRFLASVDEHARKHNGISGHLCLSDQSIMDPIADLERGPPGPATKEAARLQLRLMERIALLLHGCFENHQGYLPILWHEANTIHIAIAGSGFWTPLRVRSITNMTCSIQECMNQISTVGYGEKLWYLILQLYDTRLKGATVDLSILVQKEKEHFDVMCANLTGFYDEEEQQEARDDELASCLHHLVLADRLPDDTEAEKTAKKMQLMDIAEKLQRLPNFDLRLRPLFNSTLSKKLLNLFNTFMAPRATYTTILRFCHTFLKDNALRFRIGFPLQSIECGSDVLHNQPPTINQPQTINQPLTTIQPSTIDQLPTTSEGSSSTVAVNETIPELVPITKHIRDIVESFMAHLQNKKNPSPDSPLYLMFGYVLCQNSETVKWLSYQYSEYLFNNIDESEDKQKFRNLCQHLEHNALGDLLSGAHDSAKAILLDKRIPDLRQYLNSPINERATVWNLVAFIRDEGNTNPEPCLQRDYGFDKCRHRDKVSALKKMYKGVIFKFGPWRLHSACIKGQLKEIVVAAGIEIQRDHRSLLLNNYPLTGVGYARLSGHWATCGSLFRQDIMVGNRHQ
jgi:hypothetical protein